jgi:RecJ-like exonuclease
MKRNRNLSSHVKNTIGKCVNCGGKEKLETHHIVALTNGGADIESNITVLCHDCHCKAHNKVNKGYSKPGGRKPKVSYEEACKHIDDYINCKITSVDLKIALKVGENSNTTIKDIRSVKRYIAEKGISEEQLNKASRNSAYILTGYECYLR